MRNLHSKFLRHEFPNDDTDSDIKHPAVNFDTDVFYDMFYKVFGSNFTKYTSLFLRSADHTNNKFNQFVFEFSALVFLIAPDFFYNFRVCRCS